MQGEELKDTAEGEPKMQGKAIPTRFFFFSTQPKTLPQEQHNKILNLE